MAPFSALIPQSAKNYLYHLPQASLAALLYGFPARRLTVIGVTGSDGKTTTATLIHHILIKNGYKSALISTVSAKIGDDDIDTGFHVTSPEPFLLQKLIRRVVNQGFSHLVLEVTSHGLDQFRTWGIHFQVGVHTNITHEHIDYHKSYARYVAAKAKLFSRVPVAVLNKDDKSFTLLKPFISRSTKIITYAIGSDAQIKARDISLDKSSSSFQVIWGDAREQATLPLPGRHNIQNALAGLGAVGALGVKLKNSVKSLKDFTPIVGRLSQVHQKPTVYIDFAHTPHALEQVLSFLKESLASDSRLIVVFGCAGERDFLKRPMMGKIAARLAHISIFTAEDPRSESVNKIITQMVAGAKQTKAVEQYNNSAIQQSKSHIFIREPDRQRAIGLALKLAHPSDVIIITGKGHERSMNYGHGEVPWSDFDAVNRALKNI